jgi:hypothetical protein
MAHGTHNRVRSDTCRHYWSFNGIAPPACWPQQYERSTHARPILSFGYSPISSAAYRVIVNFYTPWDLRSPQLNRILPKLRFWPLFFLHFFPVFGTLLSATQGRSGGQAHIRVAARSAHAVPSLYCDATSAKWYASSECYPVDFLLMDDELNEVEGRLVTEVFRAF